MRAYGAVSSQTLLNSVEHGQLVHQTYKLPWPLKSRELLMHCDNRISHSSAYYNVASGDYSRSDYTGAYDGSDTSSNHCCTGDNRIANRLHFAAANADPSSTSRNNASSR